MIISTVIPIFFGIAITGGGIYIYRFLKKRRAQKREEEGKVAEKDSDADVDIAHLTEMLS